MESLALEIASKYPQPIQLQEYQTDVERCRFDTLGKSNPAHHAGAHTAHGRWEAPPRWESASATAACPPTRGGALFTAPEWWVFTQRS